MNASKNKKSIIEKTPFQVESIHPLSLVLPERGLELEDQHHGMPILYRLHKRLLQESPWILSYQI